jgi:hypothetical protein
VLGAVLQGVRQMLDLDADPARIDPVLATLPVPRARHAAARCAGRL